MLKIISRLEHVIGDRVYHFMADGNSPTHEVKEALFQFIKEVVEIEETNKAAVLKASEEQTITE